MGKPVVKNYIDPISGELVIGGDMEITGTLVVDQNATVTGLIAAPLPAAGTKLGGIKAAAKGEGDTVEVKIGVDEKLYTPTYPVVPVAANQAISVAADVPALLVDFNALLLALKTAGLMTADE